MKTYRKKPVTVQAVQFRRGLTAPEANHIFQWIEQSMGTCPPPGFGKGVGVTIDPGDGLIVIRTLEGDMKVDLDDWIIRGVVGEFYPCKPDIFAATYDEDNPQETSA